MTANTLTAPRSWLNAINVLVIGAGGNGGEAVDALAQFHVAMLALGHPQGLSVTILDDGEVREANLVRQRFWPGDLGQYKAICLANRYNLMMGLDWKGLPFRFEDARDSNLITTGCHDLIITAVDTPSARREVHATYADQKHYSKPIWLDLGNNQRNGQAILGRLGDNRYPTVVELYPELADMADDPRKSCSAADALGKQDCLINRMVTTAGMNLIWELIRHGETTKNGVILDMASGRQLPRHFPDCGQDSQAA
ncbi:PRTRC system ThiF family protein [Vreelandella rituensis]|uniref:PRTRC system ThiF family protein n=1 Tax=Vreelandella rituensis TaxID=2282306 RepID=A0A368U9I7_9GAMM|nr:PRTRC system ThiF family protein [Halomonas rituensis]RCV93888.1 PRTRC system ThiF family protein [Halomonas rituensis]